VSAFVSYEETGVESVLLSLDTQDAVEREAGLGDTYFVNFRLSREHWRDELAVCQQCHRTLRIYGLA
jgi:hypothetical protein